MLTFFPGRAGSDCTASGVFCAGSTVCTGASVCTGCVPFWRAFSAPLAPKAAVTVIKATAQRPITCFFIVSAPSFLSMAIPHNSKCRYGKRGAADAKPKAQIILDAAKVSAASGGNSEPKQGQRSQSARGFCPRSTMRVPQPDIIEHFGNADAVPQPPKRCLSRKAGIVRCCLRD